MKNPSTKLPATKKVRIYPTSGSFSLVSLMAVALEVAIAGTIIVAVLYAIFPFKFDV